MLLAGVVVLAEIGKISHTAEFSPPASTESACSQQFTNVSSGTTLAMSLGMKRRPLLYQTASIVVLSLLRALALGANPPLSVGVEDGAGKTYVVDAAFDVNAPATVAWEVLTDYEGIGRFVSSIRQSTIRKRESGRVLLEQHGVGRAWIGSLPMHVVLEIREEGQRMLIFRDVCGKSFYTYEGAWELTAIDGGTHVSYRLKADPSGRQAAMLARSAIRGSVKKLLNEVRNEILVRAAR